MKQEELERIYTLKEDEHKQIALAWSPIMRRVYVVKRFAVHARPQVYEQLKQSEEKGIVRIIQVEQEETGFSVIEEYLNGELLSVWMKRTHGGRGDPRGLPADAAHRPRAASHDAADHPPGPEAGKFHGHRQRDRAL